MKLKAAALIGLLACGPLAMAETLTIPLTQQGDASVKTPKRGAHMSAVESEFGKPPQVQGPVGTPPITRWIYPQFTVTFEKDIVIASVITFTPKNDMESAPQTDEAQQ